MAHFPLYKSKEHTKTAVWSVFCLVFCWQLHRGPREQSSRDIAGTAVSVMGFSVHLENKTRAVLCWPEIFFHYNERKGANTHLQSTETFCLTQNESFHFVSTVLSHFLIHAKFKTRNTNQAKCFVSSWLIFLTFLPSPGALCSNARWVSKWFCAVFELHGRVKGNLSAGWALLPWCVARH